MRDRTLIGPWIRRFLLEHLVSDRNLTHNTQASYRDTLLLLLPFVSQAQKKPTDRLTIDDLSPSRLRSFLQYLEKERGCSGATRNLRLAAICSLAKFIAMRSPEHVALVHRNPCGSVQEDAKIQSHLPRQTGNRCAVESPRSANATGEPRLRITTVPLQHWRARGGSCAPDKLTPSPGATLPRCVWLAKPTRLAPAPFGSAPPMRSSRLPLDATPRSSSFSTVAMNH